MSDTLVDLQKQAAKQISDYHLQDFRAQVAFVLDISKSMFPLYRDGVMQRVIERIIGLALNFDDDGAIDMYLFGSIGVRLTPVSPANVDGYARREIVAKHDINGRTEYARALYLLDKQYLAPTRPVFVVFLTDGNNSDKKESQQLLRELSNRAIFFKFVGIGKEEFTFLEKLSELKGRYIDNTSYTHVNDIATVSDAELYGRLLGGVDDWRQAAQKTGIL